MAAGISIKDAQHLTTLNDEVEIPVSDGTDEAKKITIGDIKNHIGSGLTDDEREALDELIDAKNPLTVTATGGGTHEIGSTHSPSGTITVKKGSVDVTDESTLLISSGSISGNSWSDSNVLSNKSWTITAVYNNKQASTSVSVSFLPYIYYGVVNSSNVSESIIKGLSKTLSNDTTRGTTELAAGKYYIFACKGSVNLVCRENGFDALVDATIGTISITRVNNTGTDTYSYIVVPASDISWKFKITNS